MSGRACTAFTLLLLSALAGCDSPVVAPVDAAVSDAYQLPMSRLLGPCVEDWQCPGAGAFCRSAEEGFPGGQCTSACTDRTECDDGAVYNECLLLTGATAMACEAYCRNGSDCRTGYTCQVLGTDAAGATRGVCLPVCATDAECGGTSQCDPYTGRCVAMGGVHTTGAVTGEACTSDAACRSGNCRLPVENASYTGYLGGYCQSLCRIPQGYNTNNFFDGPALPQGTCTGDAVCLPGGNQQGAGDLGVCLASCTSSADCRPGYTCNQTIQSHTFTNGYCAPVNCMAAGMTCPTGTCHAAQDSQGNVYGICG
jgi:hypothetical protein